MVSGTGSTNPLYPTQHLGNDKGLVPEKSSPNDVGLRPEGINIGEHRNKTISSEVQKIDIKTENYHPPQQVIQALLNQRVPEDIATVKKTMEELPENPNGLPNAFTEIDPRELEPIQRAFTTETSPLEGVKDGNRHYNEVLGDLNRLKDRLGGSPNFPSGEPRIDVADTRKKFFGIPMTAVKDWFKMVLKDQWIPQTFWKAVARMFDVNPQSMESKYEHAHLALQRFGMIAANKERFDAVIDAQDSSRYSELNQISGFMLHPDQNSAAVEKDFIVLMDQFLTIYYQDAKSRGDDALVEFFNAFEGVCFESRARAMADYIAKHPTAENAEEMEAVSDVSDWDSNSSAKDVFNKELMALGVTLDGVAPNPTELQARLEIKDIFNTELRTENGKEKPTLELYHEYALSCVSDFIMENYTNEDFLKAEMAIFAASGKEQTKDNFEAQLKERLSKFDDIEVHEDSYPKDTLGNPVPFAIDSDRTKAFIESAVQKGVLIG